MLQTKTIDFLRFPLAVGIVLIHADYLNELVGDEKLPVFSIVSTFLSKVLAVGAVPLFFLFSGFLFFYKVENFSLGLYKNKLKRRVKSLLIPYVFWNLLTLIFFFVIQEFYPDLLSGTNKLIKDYNFYDWFSVFWNIHGGNPMSGQLWFIRDLMVVSLFSPVVWLVVKKFHVFPVCLLGILWALDFFPSSGILLAFFFFSLGAYFSINKRNMVEELKPLLFFSVGVFIACAIIYLWNGWELVLNFSIIAEIVILIVLSSYIVQRGIVHSNTFLVNSSFFIYVFHYLPLIFFIKVTVRLFHPQSEWMFLSIYFLCSIFIVLFALGVYWCLKKYLPCFTAIITGNR